MKHRAIVIAAALCCGFLSYVCAADWNGLDDAGLSAALSGFKDIAAPPIAPVQPPERPRRIICVDAGHPNTFNSGLAPVSGTNETHINWVVAVKLERILKEKGFDVLMTKSSELQYVENKERALMANNGGAALAVHLHCESSPGTGFVIYYPDRQGVEDYGNDPDNGFKGPSKQVIEGSLVLAEAMRKGMAPALAGSLDDGGVRGDSKTQVGSNQGALTFSIFSKIPTITIEMAVLTNRHDAAFIKSDEGQEKMAQAIAAGILLYPIP
ncbi:MAG: N-acetylmuramoyl-L-alanine amidase [Elusimicrobia bacterium]|nr:N-acetylmuramoyl-L-alanine amidase [Elusimicrobiota bacterium]